MRWVLYGLAAAAALAGALTFARGGRVDAAWYVPAPAVVPYDFSMSDEQIFETLQAVQRSPGYKTYGEWSAETAAKMRSAGVWCDGA